MPVPHRRRGGLERAAGGGEVSPRVDLVTETADGEVPDRGHGLIRSSFVHAAVSVTGSLGTLVLLIVLTRTLTAEDHGMIATTSAMAGIMASILGLAPNAYATHRFEHLDRRTLADHLVVAAPLLGVSSLIAAAVLLLLRATWGPFDVPLWVVFALVGAAALERVFTLGVDILMMQRSLGRFATLSIGRTALTVGGTVTLVTVFGFDWRATVLSAALTMVALTGPAIVALRRARLLGGRYDRAGASSYVRFSVPVVFHNLGFWAINAQDRFFVVAMVGLGAAGKYGIGYSLGFAVYSVLLALYRAALPRMHAAARDEEHARLASLVVGMCSVSVLVAALAMVGAHVLFPIVVGERFHDAYVFVPWVIAAYAANGVRTYFVTLLYIQQRSREVAVLTAIAFVVNGVANYVFIGHAGAVGAAWATLLTFAALAAATAIVAQRSWPLPWADGMRRLVRSSRS